MEQDAIKYEYEYPDTQQLQQDPLALIDTLCRLSERCQAVAEFSEKRDDWYFDAELYATKAKNIMDGVCAKRVMDGISGTNG